MDHVCGTGDLSSTSFILKASDSQVLNSFKNAFLKINNTKPLDFICNFTVLRIDDKI